MKDYKGWKFNWSITEKNGYHIYELFLKGDDIVQGRISVKVDGGVADVDIVETAPHNYSTQEDMKELAHIYLQSLVR